MGRTLDYERSFGEQVVVTPRRFPLRFRHGETLEEHYALVGMAHVAEGWPLYYDAVNEKGLGMAGLLFPESGRYGQPWPGWRNAASFELIPWVLGRCATASEARELLVETRVTEEGFSRYLYSAGVPDPELIIRPSGEMRTSNFLLWQSAYSEYVFMDILWPDFREQDLDRAIAEYARRNRRFGGT